ncbi:MAG TPA: lanthionine synthetase LanC family protein [Puia sp.]|nr:lanthionine synthetase LanC family protein [Puia sp.]
MYPLIRIAPGQTIEWCLAYHRYLTGKGLYAPGKGETGHNGIIWHNPDNLAYGMLGDICFAVELYRYTGDPSVWKEIEAAVSGLESYCNQHRTRNYSFLLGRSGLAFLYVRLFSITGDALFLLRAENIIEEYYTAFKGHRSLNDNHNVAAGTAGILLCCLSLLKETKKEWVYDAVKVFAQSLVKKAMVSYDNIYWNGSSKRPCQDIGWTYGDAGIAFVFLQLGTVLQDESCLLLANRILQVDDALCQGCVVGQRPIDGKMGADLVRLYAGRLTGSDKWTESWFTDAAVLKNIDLNDGGTPKGSLYNGLAGFGLVFCNAYALTGNEIYLDRAHAVGARLMDNFPAPHEMETSNKSGLFSGTSGIGYFLLRLARPEEPDPLFFPVSEGWTYGDKEEIIDWAGLNNAVLEKQAKQTIALARSWFPEETRLFLEEKGLLSHQDFDRFVHDLREKGLPTEKQQLLRESLDKDQFIAKIRRENKTEKPMDDSRFGMALDEILSLPIGQFLQLNVRVATDLHLLYQEDPIDLQLPLSPQQAAHLLTTYGSSSYFFRIDRFSKVVENRMGVLRILVDLCAYKNNIKDLIDAQVQMVMGQNEELQAGIMHILSINDRSILPEVLESKGIEHVRGALMLGLLEIF